MEPYVYPEGCVFDSLEDIAGKKITIMGLGLNGGGEACVRFFLKHGAYVTVTDMKTPDLLAPTLKKFPMTLSWTKAGFPTFWAATILKIFPRPTV